MSEVRCPDCGSGKVWANGLTRGGKRQLRCSRCHRVFVAEPHFPAVVVEIAEALLQEQVPVAVITRAMAGRVSRRWLYNRRQQLGVAAHGG